VKKKIIQYSAVLFVLVLVAGCTKQETVMKQATYDSVDLEGAARIRMFGQNGLGIFFNENSACFNRATRTAVSGDMSSAFGSFIGLSQNESLGMTETDRSINISDRNGLLSRAYYRERYINSDKPVTISGGFTTMRSSCGTLSATFTPETGKQYEAVVDIVDRGNACKLTVSEIMGDGSVRPVPLRKSPEC